MRIQNIFSRKHNYFVLLSFVLLLTLLPVQVNAAQIMVHANVNPGTVTIGQPAEIFVKALTPQGTPLPQAHVKISVGGGFFLHSNTTTVHGLTNAQGDFGTPWKCTQCAGGYEFVIEVTKPGFQKATVRTHVNIASVSKPMPGPGGQITVHTSTHPGTVMVGQPAEIFVKALTPQGTPLPQAHVKISVGGGFFLHSNTTTVHGQTNAQGDFGTPWKCTQCAGGYEFVIEVTKPGFQAATARTHVNIASQPKPGPGGRITVHASTHPANVSKGQPTEIFVKALSPQGIPIPFAHVKISAGGGVFRQSKGLTVQGQTNAQGDFAAQWKCVNCAPAYVFGIEVTKPGFQRGTAQAQVNIKMP